MIENNNNNRLYLFQVIPGHELQETERKKDPQTAAQGQFAKD